MREDYIIKQVIVKKLAIETTKIVIRSLSPITSAGTGARIQKKAHMSYV